MNDENFTEKWLNCARRSSFWMTPAPGLRFARRIRLPRAVRGCFLPVRRVSVANPVLAAGGWLLVGWSFCSANLFGGSGRRKALFDPLPKFANPESGMLILFRAWTRDGRQYAACRRAVYDDGYEFDGCWRAAAIHRRNGLLLASCLRRCSYRCPSRCEVVAGSHALFARRHMLHPLRSPVSYQNGH
ncbi:hypothetical protein KCP78_00435 [Salmonella enterica subsp. enterica]|nr:hypothetical protein KCP78_00435 [Salmonella enterica subsp. enterica]